MRINFPRFKFSVFVILLFLGICFFVSSVYATTQTYNFDSDTVGQVPTGWTSNVGTWQTQNDVAYSGTNSLKITASQDRGRVLESTEMTDVTISAKIYFGATSTKAGLILRSNSAGTSYYRYFFNTGSLYIQRDEQSGSLATATYTLPSTGVWYNMKFQATSSTLQGKIWLATDSEPVGWNIQATDSNLTSGYSGLFFHSTVTWADDVTIDGTASNDPTAVSASQSTTSSSPSSIPPDGTTTSTITVTVKNYLGNPLSGKTVTISSNRGATDTLATISGTSDVNGQAQFTIKSSTEGSAVLTAIAGGITVTDTETITFTSGVITTTGVTYTSTLDNLSLVMDLSYDNTKTNMPIILVLHGYSGPFGGDDIIQRFAKKGLFAIKTYKRSFGGSQGTSDDSAREIYDFVDAVEYVKSHYSSVVDPTNINVVGYSGGGGNVYGLITKFPDYFRTAQSFFGMSDYGYNDTYGWWNNGGSGYQATMQSRIGGTPSQVRNNYYARAHYFGAKNNPYTHIQLFTDTAETVVPSTHATQYTTISDAAGFTNVVSRVSDTNTTVEEMNENFSSALSNWLSANAGSTQYTRNSSGYIDWTTNTDTTHDVLYKKLKSLRNYDKTDHFKADFEFQVSTRPTGSAVMFGFRNSSYVATLQNSIAILLLDVAGTFNLYSRVDYNGTPLDGANRTLQAFTTTLTNGATYHITIEVNNSVVTTTLKDASLNTLETQTQTMDGAKGFNGVDSFGIYDFNNGSTGGMVGTFDNLTVNSWARWIHGYPQEGAGGPEGDITAENLFIPDIIAGTYSNPTLLTSGTMFIPGYIKTKQFYLMLGNGNDQAGNITYNISGNASTITRAKSFIVEGLTGTAGIALKEYNLSANTEYYIKDSNLTGGGSTVTTATTNGDGILTFSGTLGSIHKYEIYQNSDATAPSGVDAPTFGTITSSSIQIIKPATVTETGSGLYEWQARRNGTTELGFNAITTTSVTDNSLSENTQYTYDAQFNDNAENVSSYGTSAQKYTLADTPTNLSASLNSNNITLTVDSFPNDTSGQSGYYFSRSGGNSGWIQTNSWTDTGLSCGHEYTYSVKYRNGDGTDTSEISTTKSTSGCGGGGSPAIWTLPVVPQGGYKLSINNGALTTSSRNVILNFNAGADIKKMAISMTGDFTDASQENYIASKQWDLCSKLGGAIKNLTCPDGIYKVYAQFYTVYGRSSPAAVVSSAITLKAGAVVENLQQTTNLPFTNPFTKYLQYKQTNNDVKRLQIFLNLDPDTKIADTGFGSPGKETNYFGLLTYKAVIKFQEKYAKDILTPNGLKKGTGYVGKSTLNKINELIKK